MNEMALFSQIKNEPMALLILCAALLYKVLSTLIYFIQHKYFEKPDKRFQILSKDILKLIIYSSSLPKEDRLESLYNYLFIGGNGEVLKYGMKELILPDKALWEKISLKKSEKQPDFNPKKIFEQSMAAINQCIFDKV